MRTEGLKEELKYESLVKAYYANLHQTLRSFKSGPSYLETWVHDEDHSRSIIGIFEACYESKVESLTLLVGREYSDGLDRIWLKEQLSEFGSSTLEETPSGMKVSLVFKRGKIPDSPTVYPIDQRSSVTSQRNAGIPPEAGASERMLEAAFEGMHLYVTVDRSGKVVDAKHLGALGIYTTLMERFCEYIRGCPIQASAEHGVMELEMGLRDPLAQLPIRGILLPENMDPIFRVPLKLIRTVYEQYLKTQGGEPIRNTWEHPISPEWNCRTNEEKQAVVRKAMKSACEALGLAPSAFGVVCVKGPSRVVLSYQGTDEGSALGHWLICLEDWLKKNLEPSLELILQSQEDRNMREVRTQRTLGGP